MRHHRRWRMTAAGEVFISNLGFALGSQRFTVEQSAAAGRTLTAAGLLRDAGFAQHWVSATEQTAYDLAHGVVAAMGSAVAATGAVIYATCLPRNGSLQPPQGFAESRDVKALMDFPVSHLQADFGLDEAIVIGIGQQACTSFLGGLRVARAMLLAEPDLGQFLCVTADRFPPGALYEQAYSLVSDGAAGCLVTRDDGDFRLLAGHHLANGALAQAGDDATVGAYFTHVHRLVTELLGRNGMTIEDVAWIVPQNLNVHAWQVLAGLLHFDAERVWAPSLAEVGHVISGDNVVNLAALLASGRVAGGERVLLVMGGYGMNWQATLLERT